MRDQQKAATRELLLEAAKVCTARTGYGGMTIEQVAAQAGVSRATYYLHFSSKGELAQAVIDDLRIRSATLIPSHTLAELDRQQIDVIVRRLVAFYREEVEGLKLWYEAAAMEPGLEGAADATRSVFRPALVGEVRWASRAAARKANLVVTMMVLQLDRLCFAWLVGGWPMEESDVIAEVVLAWDAYYVPRLRDLSNF